MKWRQIQRTNITSTARLASFLQIKESHLCKNAQFPLNLPMRLAKKMKKGDLQDPLFLQFAPLALEDKHSKLFVIDPTGDKPAQKCDRLIHKYQARALLLVTPACAMNCRYCFRRHFDYSPTKSDSLITDSVTKSIQAIAKDPSIKEVILSGGDPLSLSDKSLQTLFDSLDAIDHVKIVRLHSRFLIGIPERITKAFLEMLANSTKTIIFVQHINHIKELDKDILDAFAQIRSLGIPILSQTVLLKGVNDFAEVLEDLFWALAKSSIIPYYLHQLDRVQGAAHFEVPIKKGLQLIQTLQERLPGYAVPRYVQDLPNQKSKSPLTKAPP